VLLPSSSGPSDGGTRAVPGGGGDRKPPKKPEDDKSKPKPPGALKGVADWTDDTHLRLGARIYDVDGIAKRYKLAIEDVCWPVQLSSKPGADALALCPNWGKPGHTSQKSEAHVRCKNWNAVTIEKEHSVKAAKADYKANRKRKEPI
tara:strand:+ start:71 stop:511 length:441 start_codon:yes stop_codon:yes gene_type:complete